jgi:cytochrome c
MKKMILCFCVAAGLYACGNNESSKNNTDTKKSETADVTDDPAFIKGRDLVKGSDCLTCHKIDEKLIGPSYRSIAEKYANTEENRTMLAGKVMKGGSGNWGTIPMTAHPAMSVEDATAMATYVLLLKK